MSSFIFHVQPSRCSAAAAASQPLDHTNFLYTGFSLSFISQLLRPTHKHTERRRHRKHVSLSLSMEKSTRRVKFVLNGHERDVVARTVECGANLRSRLWSESSRRSPLNVPRRPNQIERERIRKYSAGILKLIFVCFFAARVKKKEILRRGRKMEMCVWCVCLLVSMVERRKQLETFNGVEIFHAHTTALSSTVNLSENRQFRSNLAPSRLLGQDQ